MNDTTQRSAPDHGEPWSASDKALYHREGPLASFMITAEMAERVVQCVNACQGMTDPAAEIQAMRDELEMTKLSYEAAFATIKAMRDAIKEAHEAFVDTLAIARIKWGNRDPDANTVFENASTALAKLKPFLP